MKINLKKDLSPLKRDAKERVDREAGEVRKMFITDAPGQDMVYKKKLEEAERFLTDPNVDLSDIPHIVSESEVTNMTMQEVSQRIIGVSRRWSTISAMIEKLRMSAKAAVEAARNPAEVEAASNVNWEDVKSLA